MVLVRRRSVGAARSGSQFSQAGIPRSHGRLSLDLGCSGRGRAIGRGSPCCRSVAGPAPALAVGPRPGTGHDCDRYLDAGRNAYVALFRDDSRGCSGGVGHLHASANRNGKCKLNRHRVANGLRHRIANPIPGRVTNGDTKRYRRCHAHTDPHVRGDPQCDAIVGAISHDNDDADAGGNVQFARGDVTSVVWCSD